MSRPPVDRSGPPPEGEVRLFQFPPFLRAQLSNGLTVLAARRDEVPLVSLELVAPGAGGLFDTPGSSGLATLTAALLDEGTARRSSMEIASHVERLGGYLTTGADWDVGFLATGILADQWEAGLDLLSEVLGTPTFPDEEVGRLRRQRLAEILRRTQDPTILVDDRISREIFCGTVYAGSLLGQEETVAAIDREAVVGFYRRQYSLRGSTLIAVGSLDPELLLRRAEAVFGTGPDGPPVQRPEIRPTPFPGVAVHIVDRPNAPQTELRLGHAGVSRKDPDYTALTIVNALLGGKFTSRINLNLRERHGYTYGASSRFVPRLGAGPFLVGASVQTPSAGAATREVLAELRRIRDEPMMEQERQETLDYMIGVFPYTVQTIGDFVKRLETLSIYGLPDDYFDTYLRRLRTYSAEDLQEAARRHIDPDHIAIVVSGPAELLEPQLEGLGPVTVWSTEAAASTAS